MFAGSNIAVNIEEIFATEIEQESIPSSHPKIFAMKKELQNNSAAVDLLPHGSIELSLPIPVQLLLVQFPFRDKKRQMDGTLLMIVKWYIRARTR